MPLHTTAVPIENPSSTPDAVETMLDGTGRKTSRASNEKIAPADQPPRRVAAGHGLGEGVELLFEQEEWHQHHSDQDHPENRPPHTR